MPDNAAAERPPQRAARLSDATYAEVIALLDRHVADIGARFELKRAVIEYGKQEAFHAIDTISARLRGATNDA